MQFKDRIHFSSKISFVLIAASLLGACGDGSQQQSKKKLQSAGTVQSEAKQPVLTAQINSAPLFDSQQGWSDGYTKAMGHGPGVVVGPGVGNPNVFAQRFSAKPNDQFKVVARASSVDRATAMGRIQINWTDQEGKFISVSSQAFKVTSDEKTFEHQVRAPAGVANGTLYVVANGPEQVVRYTEMRLLGEEGRAGANSVPDVKAVPLTSALTAQSAPPYKINVSPNPFPTPPNLTPLNGSGSSLTVAESQYYFYHAAKAMQRKALALGMDFIMYVMPDYNISRLMPAIQQLRSEGIKVLAYEPQGNWTSGVDTDWYWQQTDSHWTEAAVRLTADELLNMRKTQTIANRPFSKDMMTNYANGFPASFPKVSGGHIDPVAVKRVP